jgi:hypothetical protein
MPLAKWVTGRRKPPHSSHLPLPPLRETRFASGIKAGEFPFLFYPASGDGCLSAKGAMR